MMDDFLDDEAEVGSSEDSEVEVREERNILSDDEDEDRSRKRKKKSKAAKKKKQRRVDSDDEEDGEDLDRDLEDLIDDNPIEEDDDDVDDSDREGGSGDEGGEKRKHDESDMDEDLEDDDYDLLEENLGIKVQRQKKKRRIKVMEDDDDEEEGGGENEKDVIEKEIFDGDDDDDLGEGTSREPPRRSSGGAAEENLEDEFEEGSGEESDENDFIVDDDGKPISAAKKKKKSIFHDDAALQEAQELFGVDFDFDDLEQLDDEEEEEEEEEEQDDDFLHDEEEGEEGEPRPRPAKAQKKTQKRRKTTIYEVFEPSDLERGHFTDYDQEIRMADLPERFQLRAVPVCPAEEGELDEESEWIYKCAFSTAPISRQEYYEQEHGKPGFGGGSMSGHKGPGTVLKIREALNLMRNQKFEVPFIAFYRKEYIEPQLNIVDVWKIYKWDEKWMQLRTRKQNLVQLFQQMQQYQFDMAQQLGADKQLSAGFRTLTDDDVDRARAVQSMDELHDVYSQFQLYYGADVPKMKAAIKAKKKKEQQEANGGEEQDQEEEADALKQATKKSGYIVCVEAGLADLSNKFGLTAEQFGENLRDNYQRNEVEQDPNEPSDLAVDLVGKQFSTVQEVLVGAQHIVAMQLAHDPVVRSCVRQTFYERAKISSKPTKKGLKEIDEGHACYTFKYLKNKTVQDLSEDQFLKLYKATTEDHLFTYEMHIDEPENPRLSNYIDEIRQLYHRDEFSNLVQEWNNQRSAALEKALSQILYPQLVKELTTKLLEEAKESVVRASSRKLYNWLKVAPYAVDQPVEDEDEDYDTSHGVRVMGVSYSLKRDEVSFCSVVDGDGEVIDHLRLPHITKRKMSWNVEERKQKEADLKRVKEFILSRKPHVIAVGAENRDATRIVDDFKAIVSELEQEHNMIPINVELIDTELAIVYANSNKSENELREYPQLLRQSISLARRLQDPLIEFSQLCNVDEDILSLRYHSLQDSVSKDELMEAIYLEFVNRVNEVGVDVNRCIAHPHTSALIQFVCGLGPRKGNHLLKTLKQNNTPLENRTQLVTHQHVRMGPKVFLNCSGFIKINTSALADSTEQYVEVLDGSRIHPETYEWARKMAVDALEYDDTAEDANPAGALEEILESPERLKDLDLDAFAEELQRQGYGDKHITLYDIRAELNHRYKDLRIPYRSCTVEERFNLLTKETPQTFYIGKLLTCQVTGIAHRRPQGEQLEVAHPVRNDETGLWQCPFCQKNNFPELSEVWNHFDAGGCPGQAVGVKTRLDNAINGFIHVRNLSDKHVTNPEERVKTGMMLHARITKIDIDRFQVELTSKSSDLIDADSKWKLQKDAFYDYELEESEKLKEEEKKKQQSRQTYVKRVIVHPSFHNVDYKTCEKLMLTMDQGDIIIRPSSKGTDRLTVTWKVTSSNILQNIDVQEENKENSFSIGKCLKIGGETFEDLDEIIARHIQPMASFARDIINYKSYKDVDCNTSMDVIERTLAEEKMKAPSKIPYYFSPSSKYPGKFLLSYRPRTTCKHEYVTVTPEGMRYRVQMFPSLNSMIRWFKEHFRDPIPGTPMGPSKPPGGGTPLGGLQNVDAATIQRAAAGLPSSVYSKLQQVAGQRTPYGGGGGTTPYGGGTTPFGQYQAGLTTPMTPMMTPGPGPGPQQQMRPPTGRPPMATPQYQMTPRAGGYPPGTPGGGMPHRTPAGAGGMPHRTPAGAGGMPSQSPRGQQQQQWGQRTPRGGDQTSGKDAVSMDWAKRAEMWAKSKAVEQPSRAQTPSRRTPRQSPYNTPGGDQTPLVDEDR